MQPCKLGAILDELGIEFEYFEDKQTHYVFAWRKEDKQTKNFVLQRLKDEYGRTITF